MSKSVRNWFVASANLFLSLPGFAGSMPNRTAMSQLFKTTLSLACLVFWIKPGISQTLTNEDIEPRVTLNVQVHNMARAWVDVVTDAEKEAARIFRAAGIQINWNECRCSPILSPTSVMLRIIPRFFGSLQANSRRENLGYAVTGTEGGGLATVFYDRVEATAKGENLSRVLGYAIAHEIGHILLGQSSHSPAGLMRANWSEKDLKPAHRDRMQFTPDQAERMRTGLGSEMKQKESLQSSMPN
jgi:hypothetical protein